MKKKNPITPELCFSITKNINRTHSGYRWLVVDAAKPIINQATNTNLVLIIREGQCRIKCNEHTTGLLSKMQMVIITRDSLVSITTPNYAQLLLLHFDFIIDKQQSDSIYSLKKENGEPLGIYPIKVKQPILQLANQLDFFKYSGIERNYFTDNCQQLFFGMLLAFYESSDVHKFMSSFLYQTFDFRTFVLNNYLQTDYNVNTLIGLSRMNRTTFYTTFKRVFGVTTKQWMLQQYATTIASIAATPGITVNEIMSQLDVKSQCHFFRVCKRYFSCTPSELIEQMAPHRAASRELMYF